jgi:hypothetical protein
VPAAAPRSLRDHLPALAVGMLLLPHLAVAAHDLVAAGLPSLPLPPARARLDAALAPLGRAFAAVLEHVPERGTVLLLRPERHAPQAVMLGQLLLPRAVVDPNLLAAWAARGGAPAGPPEFVLELDPGAPEGWSRDYRLLDGNGEHRLWQRRAR